jgi:hypothetical protein
MTMMVMMTKDTKEREKGERCWGNWGIVSLNGKQLERMQSIESEHITQKRETHILNLQERIDEPPHTKHTPHTVDRLLFLCGVASTGVLDTKLKGEG